MHAEESGSSDGRMPDTESPATFDVFISYSRRDKLFAQKLQKALQAEASPPARGDE